MKNKKRYFSILMLVLTAIFSLNALASPPPPKPNINQIKKDLVGFELTEGFEDGWYSKDWRWTIEEGEIQALKIKEVVANTNTDYCIVVLMRLQSKVNSYNTKAKVNYHLDKTNKWKIEFVVSQGMQIIQTHKYDDCLSFAIVDDGWGGVNALQIKNKSGIELGCAGFIKASGKWRKFAVILDPYQSGTVGGTFGGGSVTNYKIEFIERP